MEDAADSREARSDPPSIGLVSTSGRLSDSCRREPVLFLRELPIWARYRTRPNHYGFYPVVGLDGKRSTAELVAVATSICERSAFCRLPQEGRADDESDPLADDHGGCVRTFGRVGIDRVRARPTGDAGGGGADRGGGSAGDRPAGIAAGSVDSGDRPASVPRDAGQPTRLSEDADHGSNLDNQRFDRGHGRLGRFGHGRPARPSHDNRGGSRGDGHGGVARDAGDFGIDRRRSVGAQDSRCNACTLCRDGHVQ